MVGEHNSIFDDTANYQSRIYPFLFTHKLITNKRFQLLFNKGNLLTNVSGTNALLPVIDIYLERFKENDPEKKVLCCLGTHLFHSFVIIVESLRISETEISESIKFIISKQNSDHLEKWKYLLAFFVVYLKLSNKKNENFYLKIIKEMETDKECLSLFEYGQLQLKTVPLAYNVLQTTDTVLEDVEVVSLLDIIAADKLWHI